MKLGPWVPTSSMEQATREDDRPFIPCGPVAGAARMAKVAGIQGTNMTSRPGRLLRIGPNIAGSLEAPVTHDMLPDDPTCSPVAAYPMATWSIGTIGRLAA
jgi:hypothetical protein